MSKYSEIAQDIRASIEDGALLPGDRLPTVVELCDLYGVSKVTVRKAVELLAEQGLVSSRRGSGTFVKATMESRGMSEGRHAGDTLYIGKTDRSVGFTNDHSHEGEVTSVVYLFAVEVPPADVADRLDLEPDDFAYHDIRVRCLDGTPIVIEDTFMPLELVPGLKRHHVEGSIYNYLRDDLGLHLASFHRVIRAVAATDEEAERLSISCGDPLLEVEQIGFLDSGVPFEYSVSRNVGSRSALHSINIT
ncbi:GntR family transcriptional regulator [Atopobiaceae bacterium 24-176]